MTPIIYLVLHINYQKKNNNNKKKKMQNILTLIWGPFKWAMPTIMGPFKGPTIMGPFKGPTIMGINIINVIGLMNIQQNKKVFSKINS